MSPDAEAVAYAVRVRGGFSKLRQQGISTDHIDPEWQDVWSLLCRCYDVHHKLPSASYLESRFDWIMLPKVSKGDLEPICEALLSRHRYRTLLEGMEKAAQALRTPEDYEKGVTQLQVAIDRSMGFHTNGHLHDPFQTDTLRRTVREMLTLGKTKAIQTGIPTVDEATGGLRPKRSVVVAGRTSHGKSYLALWIIAQAVLQGHKALFYSLEMGEYEVLARLYPMVTRVRHGHLNGLRNMDFHTGKVKPKTFVGLMKQTAPELRGLLRICDDPDRATLEQIAADVEAYSPDIVWVDYLTLMPRPRSYEAGWEAVGALSAGLKRIAMRHHVVVGSCSQLNRMAAGDLAPGTHTIARSDQVGHDADLVLMLVKAGRMHKMQIEKNRGGPDGITIDLKLAPDEGALYEMHEGRSHEPDHRPRSRM